MVVKTALKSQTFILGAGQNLAPFMALHPQLVSSVQEVQQSVEKATKDSLWISYQKSLTEALIQAAVGLSRGLGKAVFVHDLNPRTILALSSYFHRFAVAPSQSFLPADELTEALNAEHGSDLIVGGSVDSESQTLTLWRGNLEPLTVPFSAFEISGDGTDPDFDQFSVTDSGQTIRLGDYEAATDALLYEFDPDYRRRIANERRQSEQSFGASLRRLRKQRGLRREDFAPEVASKTIARIERGEVQPQMKTLTAIAARLRVRPEEIQTF